MTDSFLKIANLRRNFSDDKIRTQDENRAANRLQESHCPRLLHSFLPSALGTDMSAEYPLQGRESEHRGESSRRGRNFLRSIPVNRESHKAEDGDQMRYGYVPGLLPVAGPINLCRLIERAVDTHQRREVEHTSHANPQPDIHDGQDQRPYG